MEVSDELHDPAALPSGKEPRHPLDRKLGGRDGEKKIPTPARNRTPVLQLSSK